MVPEMGLVSGSAFFIDLAHLSYSWIHGERKTNSSLFLGMYHAIQYILLSTLQYLLVIHSMPAMPTHHFIGQAASLEEIEVSNLPVRIVPVHKSITSL